MDKRIEEAQRAFNRISADICDRAVLGLIDFDKLIKFIGYEPKPRTITSWFRWYCFSKWYQGYLDWLHRDCGDY